MNALTPVIGGQPERLPFELDPSIIHHIVYSQAGSLSKALIELIMNSIDAGATRIDLTVAQTGFRIADDGKGFRSRDEVLAWFGRFGTPHEEGDATFGRFRLGRGQIMAFARTSWFSRHWRMDVDVQVNGYSYDLVTDAVELHAGCRIDGLWYEALSQEDLRTLLLDLVDLVRFTAVPVHLNGKSITVPPATSKWMRETDDAWFTATKEGSVAIYNQGVLVRFDAGHIWGAGGVIVTKKAIALNVSRTEILRKTCEVWKRIAPEMRDLCRQVSEVDDGRIDENARQRWAADILKGGEDMLLALLRPVITMVPGRHVTVRSLFHQQHGHLGSGKPKQTLTIVEDSGVMVEAEAIQRQGLIGVISKTTLQRFRCRDAEEFIDIFRGLTARSHEALAELSDKKDEALPAWVHKLRASPWPRTWEHLALGIDTSTAEFLPFEVVAGSFSQRCGVLDVKELRGPERRVWIALRWAIEAYCAEVRFSILESAKDFRFYGHGMQRQVVFAGDESRMVLLPGVSDTADGWTDGRRYIAVNRRLLDAIVKEGIQAIDAVFSVVDHELAHEGNSLDSGHDAAFFERHHDIVLRGSALRGLYKEIFLRKWLQSYSSQSKRQESGRAGMRNSVVNRLARERRDRGEDLRGWNQGQRDREDIPMPEAVPMALLADINAGYAVRGWGGTGVDLDELRRRAAEAEGDIAARREEQRREDDERAAWYEACEEEQAQFEIAEVRGVLDEIAKRLEIPADVFFAGILKVSNTLADDLDRSWLYDWICYDDDFIHGIHGGRAPDEAYHHPDLDTVIRDLAEQRKIHPKDLPLEDAIAERRIRVQAFCASYVDDHSVHAEDVEVEFIEREEPPEKQIEFDDLEEEKRPQRQFEIVERRRTDLWARSDEQEAADRARRQAVVDQSMLLPSIDGARAQNTTKESEG